VVFKIIDVGYAHVVGRFTAVAGELTFDPVDVTKSALNVTIKTAIEKTGDKTGKVTGELTLLGVTKPVTMDVTFNKVAPNPFNNNKPTAGFEALTVIKRSDFGMKAAIPSIGDEVEISIDSQAPRCNRTFLPRRPV
jgi:polyisoprenoid-binding protein YceI